MATEFRPEDEEKDKEMGAAPQLAGAAAPASPGAGGAPAGGSSPLSRQREGTGNVVNVRQYLEANKPADIAGQIQQRAQEQAGKIGQEAQQRQQQFGQQASGLEKQLGEEAESTIQTAFKDPSKILQQQDQLQKFQQLRDEGLQQQIGGLQTDVSGLQQRAGQLQQMGEQAGTEAGRFQLLRESFGQPSYSKGQQRLDQLLLQARPGQARELQSGLRDIASQTGQQVSQFGQEAEQRKAALQQLAGQRSQEIQQMLRGGAGEGIESELGQRGFEDIESDVQARLARVQEEAPEQVAAMQQRLAEGKLRQEDLDRFGLEAGQQLYDIDLGTALNFQGIPQQASFSGVLTPEEHARMSALQQLAGVDPSQTVDESQLGQYSPYTYDKERLQSALEQRGQRFGELETQAQDAAKALQQFHRQKSVYDLFSQPGYYNPTAPNLGTFYGALKQIEQGASITPELLDKLNVALPGWADTNAGLRSTLSGLSPEYKQYATGRTVGLEDPNLPSGGQFNVT